MNKRRRNVNYNNNDLLSNNNYTIQKFCLQHKNCSGTSEQVNK